MQNATSIVSIASVPKTQLASLHLKYLPTAFSGLPGRRLLTLYYESLSCAADAFGFAAVVDGCAAGFACLVPSTRSIQRVLAQRFPARLVFWFSLQCVRNPKALKELSVRLGFYGERGPHWKRPQEWGDWYLYRPLVVDENYRRYGLADALTQRLLEEAERRSIPGIIGFVERSNAQSRVTHLRNRFREVWRGERYVVFARKLGAQHDVPAGDCGSARKSEVGQPWRAAQ